MTKIIYRSATALIIIAFGLGIAKLFIGSIPPANEMIFDDIVSAFIFGGALGCVLSSYLIITELSDRLKDSKDKNKSLYDSMVMFSNMVSDKNKETFTLDIKLEQLKIENSMLQIQLGKAESLKQNMKDIAVRWQEKQRDEKVKADYLEAALKTEQGRTDMIIDRLLKEIVGGLQVTSGDIVVQPGKMSKKARKAIENFMSNGKG